MHSSSKYFASNNSNIFNFLTNSVRVNNTEGLIDLIYLIHLTDLIHLLHRLDLPHQVDLVDLTDLLHLNDLIDLLALLDLFDLTEMPSSLV